MAFIIDTYNKYDIWDRTHSVFKFRINDNWYAIKSVELEWGVPKLGLKVDQDDDPTFYYIYDTYEEAYAFMQQMKLIN